MKRLLGAVVLSCCLLGTVAAHAAGLIVLAITGDSITGCYSSNNDWPFQLLNVVGVGDCGQPTMQGFATYQSGNILMRNMAISGTRLAAGSNPVTSIALTWVDPIAAVKSFPGGQRRVYEYICAIGSNDGAIDSYATPALYAAAVAANAQLRRTAGFDKILLTTLLPRGDGTMTEPNRLAYNATLTNAAWQIANGIDGVIDFASQPIMGNPANLTNTLYYNTDLIHPTALGQSLLVPIAQPIIASYVPQ
jgi:hypothetical protein